MMLLKQYMYILRTSVVWLMPVMITTSFILLVTNTLSFLNPENTTYLNIQLYINQGITFLLPLMIASAIGGMTALEYRLPRPTMAIIAIASVFAVRSIFDFKNINSLDSIWFFVALTLPFIITKISSKLYRTSSLKLVQSNIIGSNIKETLNLLLPTSIAVILSITLYTITIQLLIQTSFSLIEIIPEKNPYVAMTLITSLNSLFWFFGIHGYYAILPLIDQLSQIDSTLDLVNPLFLGSFIFIGGSGSTLSLIIAILVLSKDRFHKKIAIISLPLAFYGINEVIVFCLPILFNRKLLIPFLLAPTVNAIISTYAVKTGIISISSGFSSVTAPVIFNAWISSNGDLYGILLQIICLTMGIIIYAPFVSMIDRARQHNKIEIPQIQATFQGINEEYSSKIDDPYHIIFSQNKEIDEIRRKLKYISELNFTMFYQPKINPHTSKIEGCEALIRAFDKNGVIVSPSLFMDTFHKANLISLLDLWVAKEVSNQIENWKNKNQELVNISINITASTLNDPIILDEIISIVQSNSEWICFELTEETLANFEILNHSIKKIKQSGINIHIDDFGTGYSSLSYLSNVDFSAIKLDRSFVENLDNHRNYRLLHAIMGFLKNMEIKIIIEGVESQDQVNELIQYNNISIQGWFYAKAMCESDLQEFISKYN